jgi:hypothetical protein
MAQFCWHIDRKDDLVIPAKLKRYYAPWPGEFNNRCYFDVSAEQWTRPIGDWVSVSDLAVAFLQSPMTSRQHYFDFQPL